MRLLATNNMKQRINGKKDRKKKENISDLIYEG